MINLKKKRNAKKKGIRVSVKSVESEARFISILGGALIENHGHNQIYTLNQLNYFYLCNSQIHEYKLIKKSLKKELLQCTKTNTPSDLIYIFINFLKNTVVFVFCTSFVIQSFVMILTVFHSLTALIFRPLNGTPEIIQYINPPSYSISIKPKSYDLPINWSKYWTELEKIDFLTQKNLSTNILQTNIQNLENILSNEDSIINLFYEDISILKKYLTQIKYNLECLESESNTNLTAKRESKLELETLKKLSQVKSSLKTKIVKATNLIQKNDAFFFKSPLFSNSQISKYGSFRLKTDSNFNLILEQKEKDRYWSRAIKLSQNLNQNSDLSFKSRLLQNLNLELSAEKTLFKNINTTGSAGIAVNGSPGLLKSLKTDVYLKLGFKNGFSVKIHPLAQKKFYSVIDFDIKLAVYQKIHPKIQGGFDSELTASSQRSRFSQSLSKRVNYSHQNSQSFTLLQNDQVSLNSVNNNNSLMETDILQEKAKKMEIEQIKHVLPDFLDKKTVQNENLSFPKTEKSLKYETSFLKKEFLEIPKKVSFNTTNNQLVSFENINKNKDNFSLLRKTKKSQSFFSKRFSGISKKSYQKSVGKTLLQSKKTSADHFSIQNSAPSKPVKQIYKEISKQEIVFFVQCSIYNLVIVFHLLKLLKSLEKIEINKPSVLVFENFKKKYFLNEFPNENSFLKNNVFENSFLKNNVLNNSQKIICLTILQTEIEPLEEISDQQNQTMLREQSSLLLSHPLSVNEDSLLEGFELPQKQGIFESCYRLCSQIKKTTLSVIRVPTFSPSRYRAIYTRLEEIRLEFASLKSNLSFYATLLVDVVITTKQDFLVLAQNNEQALQTNTCIYLIQELQTIELELNSFPLKFYEKRKRIARDELLKFIQDYLKQISICYNNQVKFKKTCAQLKEVFDKYPEINNVEDAQTKLTQNDFQKQQNELLTNVKIIGVLGITFAVNVFLLGASFPFVRRATALADILVKVVPADMPTAIEEILENTVEISENVATTSRRVNNSWISNFFLGEDPKKKKNELEKLIEKWLRAREKVKESLSPTQLINEVPISEQIEENGLDLLFRYSFFATSSEESISRETGSSSLPLPSISEKGAEVISSKSLPLDILNLKFQKKYNLELVEIILKATKLDLEVQELNLELSKSKKNWPGIKARFLNPKCWLKNKFSK